MHILLVYHTTFPRVSGGIDAMLVSLAQGLVDQGVRVSVLAVAPWDAGPWRREQAGAVTVHHTRLRVPFDRKRPWRGALGWLLEAPRTWIGLRRLVCDHGISLIHLHNLHDYQFYFRLLAPPCLLTVHGAESLAFYQGQGLHARWLRWIVSGVAGINAVSPAMARLVEAHFPALSPVPWIANGLDGDEIARQADAGLAALSALQPPPPERFALLLGWVGEVKGVDVAVAAWSLLTERDPGLHLLVVGADGELEGDYHPFRDAVRQAVVLSPARERIRFTGRLPRPTALALVKTCQCLLIPSRSEGLPYVLLEAGMLGKAVICSDIPAFAGIVQEGVNGLVTPPGDAAALATAVLRLGADAALAARLGAGLRQTVTSRYSTSAMAAGYVGLYRDLIQRSA